MLFSKHWKNPHRYALFIFHTTERHKILPTILSRCQIFNTIKFEDIFTQLKTITIQEIIPYEESALQLIAQKTECAMRDALSMFNLITTSTGRGGIMAYTTKCDHLHF